MVARKRKKSSRMRGSWTHGWGEKKKHRGAGHRGGRGMAGTGKRGDAKKPSVWKDTNYFGKHGFKKKNISEKIIAVNLRTIENSIDSWLEKKLVEEKAGVISIDLKKIGFNKLLSSGKATKKLIITVSKASAKAVEKVSKAGGKVELPVKTQAAETKKEQ